MLNLESNLGRNKMSTTLHIHEHAISVQNFSQLCCIFSLLKFYILLSIYLDVSWVLELLCYYYDYLCLYTVGMCVNGEVRKQPFRAIFLFSTLWDSIWLLNIYVLMIFLLASTVMWSETTCSAFSNLCTSVTLILWAGMIQNYWLTYALERNLYFQLLDIEVCKYQ